MSGPLTGIRVLELGQLIAAPFATRLMAEFGAEVIKVEAPGEGDPLRKWRKMHEGTVPERSIYGEAKPAEAIKLLEDGVPVAPLPFMPGRKSN